jgi:hypothetical protein
MFSTNIARARGALIFSTADPGHPLDLESLGDHVARWTAGQPLANGLELLCTRQTPSCDVPPPTASAGQRRAPRERTAEHARARRD